MYFGTWGYGRAGLEALLTLEEVEIVKVFTKWDLAVENEYLNQVYKLAIHNGLEVVNSDKGSLSGADFRLAILEKGNFDFLISCCYDRIFSGFIISSPWIAALNVHPSLLPLYRGIKPLENAVANGDTEIGVTLHELITEIDAGDIILQTSSIIDHQSNFGELYGLQCNMIIYCLRKFFTDPKGFLANRAPQDHKASTEAPRLSFTNKDSDTVHDIMRKKKRMELT